MGYSFSQSKMEELFLSLLGKGNIHVCEYDDPPFCYGVLKKEQVPQEHPLNSLRAFGSYTEKNMVPVIFVVEGRHPKEFDDNPKEFYDIAAFFTSRDAVHGRRNATLDTFNAIKNSAILEKYTRHWMRENEGILPKIPESDKELLREKLPAPSRKILQEHGYL